MRNQSHPLEHLMILLGGAALLLFVLGSWLPQPCPVVRNLLIGCPSKKFIVSQTPKAKEIRRVPHQEITTKQAFFSGHAQNERSQTAIRFEFIPTVSHLPFYLDIKRGGTSEPLALVSHPLLDTLHWHFVAGNGISLYQLSSDFQTVDDFLANLPPTQQVSADQVAVRQANLKPDQYLNLDTLHAIGNVKYILTSYIPSQPDGDWLQFDRTFDLSKVDIDKERINGDLFFPGDELTTHEPLLLGEVHIDYKQPFIHP